MGTNTNWKKWKKRNGENVINKKQEANSGSVQSHKTEQNLNLPDTSKIILDNAYFDLGNYIISALTETIVDNVVTKLETAVKQNNTDNISVCINHIGKNEIYTADLDRNNALNDINEIGQSTALNDIAYNIIKFYYQIKKNETEGTNADEEFISKHYETPETNCEDIAETEIERIKKHFDTTKICKKSSEDISVQDVANIIFNFSLITNTRNAEEFSARNEYYKEFSEQIEEIKNTKIFEILKMIALKNPFYKNLYIHDYAEQDNEKTET